jgi:hypothetical protein
VRAFRRIVQEGSRGGAISVQDILTVRSCGRILVENLRRRAIQARRRCCVWLQMPFWILALL